LLTPNPRKGIKCECDIGLATDKTCSRAYRWLFKKYKASELPYLKETYEKILNEQKIIEFEQTRQIDKDINRTFPKSKLFENGSDGVQVLKRVLNAIAKYDPSVGYVQGMNFIAGSLLFHAEEYIAFWVLVSLFEELEMRDIFLPKLPGLSKHCQITDILILNYKPNIYAQLCEFQIRPELFLTEWVLTLFGNIAPITDMGEIYDNLFLQGWVFFYKLVLAFLGHFERDIEQESDMIGVLTILKSQNRLANKPDNYKSSYKFEWKDLCKKANEIDIDPAFIYEMHLKFDIKNQWFRTST